MLSCVIVQDLKYPKELIKRHKSFKLKDNNIEPIGEYFQIAFDFIKAAVDAKEAVLVHCLKGMSRSATIVIAYIMMTTDMDNVQALKFV